MLELRRSDATLIGCYGRPEALDGLPSPSSAFRLRAARDEALLIVPPSAGDMALLSAADHVAAADPGGLVLDRTDAYALWTLGGGAAEEAFGRPSALPLPGERPALLQGLVAHAPAKVVALADAIHVLVPSTLAHHLRDRVLAACADLAPVEAPAQPLAPAEPERGRET